MFVAAEAGLLDSHRRRAFADSSCLRFALLSISADSLSPTVQIATIGQLHPKELSVRPKSRPGFPLAHAARTPHGGLSQFSHRGGHDVANARFRYEIGTVPFASPSGTTGGAGPFFGPSGGRPAFAPPCSPKVSWLKMPATRGFLSVGIPRQRAVIRDGHGGPAVQPGQSIGRRISRFPNGVEMSTFGSADRTGRRVADGHHTGDSAAYQGTSILPLACSALSNRSRAKPAIQRN